MRDQLQAAAEKLAETMQSSREEGVGFRAALNGLNLDAEAIDAFIVQELPKCGGDSVVALMHGLLVGLLVTDIDRGGTRCAALPK